MHTQKLTLYNVRLQPIVENNVTISEPFYVEILMDELTVPQE